MYLKKVSPIINLIFIGNCGNKTMIAGLGLGSMINNILGTSFFIGINVAVETLVS